jgi:hypothetical protein
MFFLSLLSIGLDRMGYDCNDARWECMAYIYPFADDDEAFGWRLWVFFLGWEIGFDTRIFCVVRVSRYGVYHNAICTISSP